MGKRKTHKEFVNEIYSLVQDEYSVLGIYENCKNRVQIRHNACGHQWNVFPNAFTSKGSRCPACNIRKRRKTHEEFVKEVFELVQNEYSVLGLYLESEKHLLMKHNKCGHEWMVTPNGFVSIGRRCPPCSLAKRSKSHEDFVKEVYYAVGQEYQVLGNYVKNDQHLLMKHMNCGHEWDIRPAGFLSGNRCPNCLNISQRKTNESYIKQLSSVHSGIVSLEPYVTTKTKIKHKCLTCGNVWATRPSDLLSGRGCPICRRSKGELRCAEVLNNLRLKFKEEFEFDGLTSDLGNPLRFDFVIFDSSGSVEKIIEYDGEFHFKKFFKEQDLELQLYHDNLKNEYCKKNNIPLLRIPYTEFSNIEDTIESFIKEVS